MVLTTETLVFVVMGCSVLGLIIGCMAATVGFNRSLRTSLKRAYTEGYKFGREENHEGELR